MSGFTSCERSDMYDMATTELPVIPAVFIFSAGEYNGNLGGRLGADSICRLALDAQYFQSGQLAHVKAFISVSEYDLIRNTLPLEYQYLPVYGLTVNGPTVQISANWPGLWDSSVDSTLESALGLANYWWSGSFEDGSFYSSQGCDGWMSTSVNGMTGQYTTIDSTWINFSNWTCANSYNLLCVAY